MSEVKRVIGQAYHRNGSGGAGFVVSIFEPTDADGVSGPFVAISMDPDRNENPISPWTIDHLRENGSTDPVRDAKVERALRDFATHTAVLNIPLLSEGNVAFGEGNSWRGSNYGEELAVAWRKRCLSGETYPGQSPFDPFDDEAYIAETDESESIEKRIVQIDEDIDTLDSIISAFTGEREVMTARRTALFAEAEA